ncbi:MAG: hypothetical protein JRC90_12295 [Deltaproteobacteria bacterium]|nr:hypothetical protein [Deltaproteobacteria bacterium]
MNKRKPLTKEEINAIKFSVSRYDTDFNRLVKLAGATIAALPLVLYVLLSII